MSAPPSKRIRDLADFADFLSAMDQEGFEFVVIGGCAVAAYSHLLGEPSLTQDLDLYASRETLTEVLEWATRQSNLSIKKSPQPRSLQVAVLAWGELEINLLCSSPGLPPSAQAARTARLFKLKNHSLLEVPILDPFDLLRNKLAVNRPKDEPHIELIQRFLETETVTRFAEDASQRDRLAPARALMEAWNSRTLPEKLTARLLAHARTAPDLRFLTNHAPTLKQARAAIEMADADLRSQLENILAHRTWD